MPTYVLKHLCYRTYHNYQYSCLPSSNKSFFLFSDHIVLATVVITGVQVQDWNLLTYCCRFDSFHCQIGSPNAHVPKQQRADCPGCRNAASLPGVLVGFACCWTRRRECFFVLKPGGPVEEGRGSSKEGS